MIRDANLAALDTGAGIQFVERDAGVDEATRTECETPGADCFRCSESLAQELLRGGCLNGRKYITTDRWVSIGRDGGGQGVLIARCNGPRIEYVVFSELIGLELKRHEK